jgi:membrane-associated phospholipid phosphatase
VTTLRRLDDHLLFAVNHFTRSTPWLHLIVVDYARFGVILFALLLVAGLISARSSTSRRLAAAAWTCLATLLAVGLNQPLGHLFHEARPYVTHPNLLVLATPTTDFSFPSDHAVMAGAVAAGLFLVSRKLGLLAALAAVTMAFARIYIAAHYPWDVLVGLAFGAAITLRGWVLLGRPLESLTRWLRQQPGLRRVFPEPGQDEGPPAIAPSGNTP